MAGLTVKTETDEFRLTGRPCELSAFSFVPTQRNDPPARTAFNTPNKLEQSTIETSNPSSTYDRLFRKQIGFNNKLHRDDREHAKSRGLTVNDEEKGKEVPTLASSNYGHKLEFITDLDPPDRKHVRVAHVRSEFFRRNGVMTQ